MATTVLQTCGISPPAGADELTIPLSWFDMIWLTFHPIRRLLFYQHPCSKSEFTDTLLPKLKQSLSDTLQHYLPVAGNLLYPSNKENKPVFRYSPGDTVPLTIAESNADFEYLIGNHMRDCDKFYDFVPQMPAVEDEQEYKIIPVFSLQLTIFPGRGICIGSANHHSLGDGNSIVGFILAWASICKKNEYLGKPIFDRSAINDHLGIDTIYWKVMREMPIKPSSFPLPTNRVRATFILSPADIRNLKNRALDAKPGLSHVSSFVVTVCYVWYCFVKSGDAVGEEVAGDVEEWLIFTADVRGRTDPPVPSNYFGNCLGYGMGKMEHERLAGDEGFSIAVEAVAEDIANRVNNKDEVLKGAENWMADWGKYVGIRAMGISGSPKFDLAGSDFGFGRARKIEVVSIDGEKYSMSLCKARDERGGLEVGLALPSDRMEAFAAIFAGGLSL